VSGVVESREHGRTGIAEQGSRVTVS
jgi:hypothetical protein